MPTRKPKEVSNATNAQRRLSDRFGGNGATRGLARNFPIDDVDPLGLHNAVAAVVSAGDAIMFARTRDGGCLVITVLSGDERKKFYPDDVDSCRFACAAICDAYDRAVFTVNGRKDPQKVG